jgi:hypothetical protein
MFAVVVACTESESEIGKVLPMGFHARRPARGQILRTIVETGTEAAVREQQRHQRERGVLATIVGNMGNPSHWRSSASTETW